MRGFFVPRSREALDSGGTKKPAGDFPDFHALGWPARSPPAPPPATKTPEIPPKGGILGDIPDIQDDQEIQYIQDVQDNQ